MKKYRILALILGAVVMTGLMTACSDDDDLTASDVPSAVRMSMRSLFPNVKDVDWDMNQGYYVADFSVNTFEKEAWFQTDGTWVMTETDYGSLTTMLPIMVQNAFNESQYSSWIVDDVQVYDRPGDSFVLIEVETAGFPEIGLFYSPTGELLNKVQGDDFNITPTTQPSTIVF